MAQKDSQNPKHTYNLDLHDVLIKIGSTPRGISHNEAIKRLKIHGANELTVTKEPIWKKLIEPFTSYFVIVIIFAALLSALKREWFETIIISIIVVVNAIIYYIQQLSSNKAMQALMSQDRKKVSVLRVDQKDEMVYTDNLVPGDVIRIHEGLRIPADGRIIDSNHIQVDESVLTGESLPVHKHASALTGIRQIYDQENMLFKGTYIHAGNGLMVITKTGNNTQLGAINTMAAEADNGKTPIEQKIDDLTKKLLIGIGIATVIVFCLALYRGLELAEALKFTIALAVSAVPEGLPIAMTLVLLISARKMAKQKALIRKISAIETMGAVTLIATDKTGTITKNQLSIADKYHVHSESELNKAMLASLNGEQGTSDDPLDQIIYTSSKQTPLPKTWTKVKDLPFNQHLRLSGSVWKYPGGYYLFVKGAPEQILFHCKTDLKNHQKATKHSLEMFTTRGYRTIAVANKKLSKIPTVLDHTTLDNMKLDGFIGLSDQLRPKVKQAIAEAQGAGIKVVMLTGDHVQTAGYIASQVSIASKSSEISDSSILDNGSDQEIHESIKDIKVFGRVLPKHKFAFLKAVKGREITAMTGDGVNDIPALVEADAGLAMGSGTDAAKDASDIILTNSNFHTIVNAVRAGRTVLANIRKMVVYLLATSGGEVLTMLAALALGIPLPISAVMVLWVNLVTDGIVVIPLGLSPAESHHMQQPPRHPTAPLLDRVMTTRAVLLALALAGCTLLTFKLTLDKGTQYAQTAAFLGLIVVQWANALNMNFEFKSWTYNFVKPNYKLLLAISCSALINIIVFTTPIKEYFGLTSLSLDDAMIAILLPSVVALTLSDLHKMITITHSTNHHTNHHLTSTNTH
ncbi:cation-transporting P-type ATPase [Candidatus Saccharibacteria bacterium]|nr:cation-transporting P-type ATPase [Candidatus Saccharibacteria bacterium]